MKNVLTDELKDMVYSEHVRDCNQNSCDINAAYHTCHYLWAIYLFDSCGAASDEFNEKYKKLQKRSGASFMKAAEKERNYMCEQVDHKTCASCNAVCWGDDTDSCDSCCEKLQEEFDE